MSGLLHTPAALFPGEIPPGTNRIGDWMAPEPVWTLRCRENLTSTGNKTRAVQPVARHYTDRAVGTTYIESRASQSQARIPSRCLALAGS
jgi:hypothetical protein